MYGSPLWHYSKTWRICCIVGRLLSVLHIAFSIYSVYYYVISNFGNIGALDFVVGCVAGLSRSKPISHMYNGSPFFEGLGRHKQFWMYVLCRSMWLKIFHHSDGFKIIHRLQLLYLCKGEVRSRTIVKPIFIWCLQVSMRGESEHVCPFSRIHVGWYLMILFPVVGKHFSPILPWFVVRLNRVECLLSGSWTNSLRSES